MTAPQDDFNFEFGRWQVLHRRLRQRLSGADDWDEFVGTSETRPVLGSAGNVEDNWLDMPGGAYRAIAIRSCDAATGQWAIWWLDQRAPHGLDVPVIGGFQDGVGEFLARDSFEGRAIIVRFRWLRTDGDSPRWEQAFSPDDGASWETNWTMDFTRNI